MVNIYFLLSDKAKRISLEILKTTSACVEVVTAAKRIPADNT